MRGMRRRSARRKFEDTCRAAARSVDLGEGTLLVTPLGALREGGLRMVVASADRGVAPHLAIDGFWEAWVSLWLRDELVASRDRGVEECILNVGANCGYYTLLAAELGAKVVAVEPNPGLVRNLIDSATLSGLHARIRVVAGACSDRTGEAELMWMPRYLSGGFVSRSPATLAAMEKGRALLAETFERATVATHRADDLCPDATLLFVDAEGHEPFVWRGAEKLRARPGFRAVLEWSPLRYDDAAGLYESILAEGFRYRRIDENGREAPIERAELLSAEHMVVLRRDGGASETASAAAP